jgi:hypothetical protein
VSRPIFNDVTEPQGQPLQADSPARDLLIRLLERELLSLESGFTLEDLVPEVAELLSWSGDSRRRARDLAEMLLAHPAVGDLYATDDEMVEACEC